MHILSTVSIKRRCRVIDRVWSFVISDALVAFKACLKIRESCLHSMNKDLSEVHDAVAQCYAVKGAVSFFIVLALFG